MSKYILLLYFFLASCTFLKDDKATSAEEKTLFHVKHSINKNDYVSIVYAKNKLQELKFNKPIENNFIISSVLWKNAPLLDIKKIKISNNNNYYFYKHPFYEGNVVVFLQTNSVMGNKVFKNKNVDIKVKYMLNSSLCLRHIIYVNKKSVIKTVLYPYFKINNFSYDVAEEFAFYHELFHGGIWQEWLVNNIKSDNLSKSRELAADIGASVYIIKKNDLSIEDSKKLLNSIIRLRRDEPESHKNFKGLIDFSNKHINSISSLKKIKLISNNNIDEFANLFSFYFYK